MTPQPPASRVGDFQIRDFVGAGGMGTVFRAVHLRSGGQVAVKFLSADAARNLKSRQRFAHEARVQASLQHPSLAAFYEWHEINGVPCIVMEWVDGHTLSGRIRASGALPVAEAAAIFSEIVAAIGWMHERGVVHRDIKSGNVKVNSRGQVKMLDFGIAKTDNAPKLTATGAFIGTLHYLSPEQLKGARADERCDIWALGVLFYEMLSGHVPFEAPTLSELMEKVARATYSPLRAERPEISRGTEKIVRRCLRKSPDARYQNIAQLQSDLQQLQTGGNRARSLAIPTPIWASVGAIVILLLGLLGWSRLRAPQTPVAPLPTATVAALAATNTERDWPEVVATARNEALDKGITVDVFGGASQTEVWRDEKLLGRPPVVIRGRQGETVELSLKRPGYRTYRATITMAAANAVYSFNLEKE